MYDGSWNRSVFAVATVELFPAFCPHKGLPSARKTRSVALHTSPEVDGAGADETRMIIAEWAAWQQTDRIRGHIVHHVSTIATPFVLLAGHCGFPFFGTGGSGSVGKFASISDKLSTRRVEE